MDTGMLVVTLLTEHTVCHALPGPLLSALCVLNMLLLMEKDHVFVSREHVFSDFSITGMRNERGVASSAKITFNKPLTAVGKESTSFVVDHRAVEHIKTVGRLNTLRLCETPRSAKL